MKQQYMSLKKKTDLKGNCNCHVKESINNLKRNCINISATEKHKPSSKERLNCMF